MKADNRCHSIQKTIKSYYKYDLLRTTCRLLTSERLSFTGSIQLSSIIMCTSVRKNTPHIIYYIRNWNQLLTTQMQLLQFRRIQSRFRLYVKIEEKDTIRYRQQITVFMSYQMDSHFFGLCWGFIHCTITCIVLNLKKNPGRLQCKNIFKVWYLLWLCAVNTTRITVE